MAAITVTCPSCNSSFPVDPKKIPENGVNARCSSCGDVFRVERPVEPEPLPMLEDFEPEVAEQPAATTGSEALGAEPHVPAEPAAAPSDPFATPAPFEQAAPETETELPAAETAEPLPAPAEPLPPPEPAEPIPEPEADDAAVAPSPQPTAETPAPPEPTEEVAEQATRPVQGFTFGKRDPTDKAKRLARVLVSDMIMYNAERHQSAMAQGTLQQDFEEEIEKSWNEFVEQVGEELAHGEGRQYWKDALNDILAKGKQVF